MSITFLRKYLNFIYTFRHLISIVIPSIILIFSLNLQYFKLDGSYKVWFEKDADILKTYEDFTHTFGDDNHIYIVFKDENGIFNKKALKSINRLTKKLLTSLYVENVKTLLNYRYIHQSKNDPDAIITNNFIKKLNLCDETYFLERKILALKNKDLINHFISSDTTTTMLIVNLDLTIESLKESEILESIRTILKDESTITDYKYWLNGSFIMKHAFTEVSQQDLQKSIPLSILLAITLLYIFFRRLSGILLPLSIVILTTLSVISLYIFFGYHFNTLTITIPLFIIAIGIADAIHIYTLWYEEKIKGTDNFQAVTIAISKNFLPIILTSITSIIGFSSLVVSEIVPVATLGTATAIGIIIAFLISIFWMPAILFLLTKPMNPHQKISKKFSFNYGSFILNKQKEIITSFIVIITLFGSGIIYIKIDSDMIKLFSENVEIRKSANFIQRNLTGTQPYNIIIDSGENGNIKNPHFLKTVEEFSKNYYSKYQDIRHIYSLANIIKHYNKIVNNDDSIPNNRNLIAQYLLLYTLSIPSSSIDTLIDINERKLHINILTDQSTTTYSKKMIEDIEKWWEKTPYKITITGKTVLNTALQNNITYTLIYSLAITLLIISIVMFLIFKKIKILWILILPNILPIIFILGIMGWFNINLDMGIAISAAIIISIAIDDSIHYLIKYFQLESDNSLSIEDKLNKILKDAGKALFFTTILLSLTFLVNLSSQFIPNQHFAIITSTGLISAFLIDILLLPVLLIKHEKSLNKERV